MRGDRLIRNRAYCKVQTPILKESYPRLAALVLKSRGNLSCFHRVFARNSKRGVQVTPARRGICSQPRASDEAQDRTPAERRAAMTWAQRLRSFSSSHLTDTIGQLRLFARAFTSDCALPAPRSH